MTAIEEQETIVAQGRIDGKVYIFTTNLIHLRALRKNPAATETDGGDDWGQFHVPSEHFDPLKGFKHKRKPMTDAQRQAASERMALARAAKGAK